MWADNCPRPESQPAGGGGWSLVVTSGHQCSPVVIRLPGAPPDTRHVTQQRSPGHSFVTRDHHSSGCTRSGSSTPSQIEERSHSYQFISAVKTSFLASQNRLQGVQNSEKFVAKNAQMLNGQISHNSVLLPILSRTNQQTNFSIHREVCSENSDWNTSSPPHITITNHIYLS